MTSNPDGLRPRGRAIVLLTKIKGTALGATTLAFFRKGDDLEAAGFENLPHDDPSLKPPKLPFRNFEKVPRHRSRFVIAFLVVVVAIGLFAYRRVPEVRSQTARVVAALGAELSNGWVYLKERVAARR
jgi:hypothetical protein